MTDVFRYGVGLDQGVGSIGWSILRLNESGQATAIERLGVHVFDAGTEGDIAGGRDQSRAAPRRMARQVRRQLSRRVGRKKALLRYLQSLGLMPPGDGLTPAGRHQLLSSVDAALRTRWEAGEEVDHRQRQLLPYRLRAAGLLERLEPWEFGRALFHLAQRRGYLSNRVQSPSKDEAEGEAPGVVRQAIDELTRQMQGAGCATLAEYFVRLNPTGDLEQRLRGRWTAREMFLEEFNRLCDSQSQYHSLLTTEVRRKLYRLIFFQRPLKGVSGLVGTCSILKDKKRAPLAHRVCQRFRILQQVNSLLIELPDHTSRELTAEERTRLIEALARDGDIAFSKLRQKVWFGLPKESRFNLERGENKRLVGDRTAAKCRQIFGSERWDAMTNEDRDEVVRDLLLFIKPAALARRGAGRWGLSPDAADALGNSTVESGYAAHCLDALKVLVNRMEDGTAYMTALTEEFGNDLREGEIHEILPPVEARLGPLRNPAVTRALTELRKLLNAIVRQYGKPTWIRLELARDLKRARKHRERITREMRAREGDRERARAKVLSAVNLAECSRTDIDRVLLADECGWICPYTGRPFGMQDIVGRHPQVDVEHIWPLSRSLDDSFLNKTLCFVDENRNVKGRRTPHEAYAGSSDRWQAILDRVQRFRGDAARIKFERFTAEEIPEDFAQRHLSETRKIGAASAEYLGSLFGGECDADGRRRVFVTSGGLTAHLRREWHLGGILSESGEKTRDDLRHHAVDALVVALTDSRAVQLLQQAAERASEVGRRMFAPIDEPWPEFLEQARGAVSTINVSYRQSRRLSGKLHAETN